MAIDFYKFIDEVNKEPETSPLFSPETPPVEDVSYNYTKDIKSDYYSTSKTPNSPLPAAYSLSQLERNPEFSFRSKRFLNGIGRNENIFEYLRDADFSLGSAITRSFEVGDWNDEEKQDYLYLRSSFNNAHLEGFKERFNLVKDVGGDILGDPFNYLAALFAIPTLGGSFAGRAALGKAAEVGVKKYTTSQLAKRGALLGAAEGAAFSGPHEYYLQDIDVNLGARDSIDLSLVGKVGLMGAGFGGLIGGGVGGITGLYGKRFDKKEFKSSNEELIDKQGQGKTVRDEVVERSETERSLANSSQDMLYKLFANTTGKPTTWFLGYVDKSPTLKKFLENLRYDYDTTLTSTGRKGAKGETYGEFEGNLNSKLQYGLQKSLNLLYGAENGLNKLGPKANADLLRLLQDPSITPSNVVSKGSQYSEETIRAYIGVRQTLDTAFKQAAEAGLFGASVALKPGYFPRHFLYDQVQKKRGKLEKLIIDAGHADPLNNPDVFKFVDQETDLVRRGILEDAKGTDQKIYDRDFLQEAGGNLEEAKKLKAKQVVDDMLEYRWLPFELRSARKNSSSGFLQERRFRNISDVDLSEFLEGDVQNTLEDYFSNVSRSIARSRFFGRNSEEFFKNFQDPIRKELQDAGLTDEILLGKIDERIKYTHDIVTGRETYTKSSLRTNPILRNSADWGKVIQQMAHLPIATLSSVTEPLLLLQRAGLDDAPKVLKDIAKGIIEETNNTVNRSGRGITVATGQKPALIKSLGETPSIKDFQSGASIFDTVDDDVWGEMYQAGLALEQSVLDRIEGLAGEGVENTWAKRTQNIFFKANLLTQWTRAVQLASFTTGKRLIVKNARQLATGKTDLGRKLTTGNKQYLTQQLNDLNIEADEAIAFYKNSLKDGQYDLSVARKNDFYNDKLVKGAARFTREIILNPSSAQANRPLWFSHPAAQILIQFAGYPTVFNNTILKKFFNESVNSPLQVMPKVLPTVLLMSSVAHLGNTIRSNGNNLKDYETGGYKSEGELLAEGIRRWGGFGPFDYASRWNNEYDRNVGGFTATAKAFAGPLPQDVIDAILYRKGLAEVGATNLPGYGAYDILFGEGTKKEIRRIARGSAPETLSTSQAKKVGTYAKGGIVTNVPNVIDEPDERIDRMTGIPYDEQAGVILKDEEER